MKNTKINHIYLLVVWMLISYQPFLLGQLNFISRNTTALPPNSYSVFEHDATITGYWNENGLFIVGKNHLANDREKLIHVQSVGLISGEHVLFSSFIKTEENLTTTVRYSLMDQEGNQIFSWQTGIARDQGLPTVTPLNRHLWILSYPEVQTVKIVDLIDNTISEFSFYPGSQWNHEKTLKVVPESKNSFFVAGMESPDLTAKENVSLFQGFTQNQPKKILTLPLTVLYDFTISISGFAAVTGTVSDGGSYDQIQKTILFSFDDFKFYEHDFLPKQMIWQKNMLYAADTKQFQILSPNEPKPVERIQFNSRIIPIQIFKSDSHVFLLYSDGGEYHREGFFYTGINLFIINTTTLDHAIMQVSKDKHRIIQVSPVHDSFFRIQLDRDIFEYRIN